MKIIAHNVENVDEAEKATKNGADILEVDVSKSLIFSKFTTQHDGVKGKFGIGQDLTPLLKSKYKSKLFLDIKHPKYSHNFKQEFLKILKENNVNGIKMVAVEWNFVVDVCKKTKSIPFLHIENKKDIDKLNNSTKKIKGRYGLSILYKILNASLLKILRKDFPEAAIYTWTVNNIKEARRLKKLGVDGIVTDNPRKISKNI